MKQTENFVIYKEEKIPYELVRSKIKNVYIHIQKGKVIVKAPRRLSDRTLYEILEKKKKWIYTKRKEDLEKQQKEKQYIDGEVFYLLEAPYVLDIAYHKKKNSKVEIKGNRILVTLAEEYMKKGYQENKEIIQELVEAIYFKMAKKIIPEEVEKIAKKMNVYPKEVKIKRLKRAWGNCSSKKIVALNYQLLKYSKQALEYVIIHELSHLTYMNHSKEFWKMVEKYMPSYKLAEAELK